ncbi:Gfo/Idh/MocA family protein [Bacillus songklensis]|uniref:Gfo/Idh/MocA family protein n=1 Tax=Bacillus songklensis TaxID=1069116 RepID=A0ABV8B8E6_9BACI
MQNPEVEAVYCAVPHHLHQQMYIDIIEAGKHLLGEKPFGIDLKANEAILKAVRQNPNVIVRCSSEFPFFPGAYKLHNLVRQGFAGEIISVEAGFWHSSDLDPDKPINWKRQLLQMESMAVWATSACMCCIYHYVLAGDPILSMQSYQIS